MSKHTVDVPGVVDVMSGECAEHTIDLYLDRLRGAGAKQRGNGITAQADLKTCAIEPVSNFNLAALTREGETLKLGRAVAPSRRKRCQDRIGRPRLHLSGEGRGQSMHTLGNRVGQLSAQFCRVVTVEKVGVGAAAQELRMAKDSDQQSAVGVQPVDVSARQHCRQTSCRLLPGGSVDDDLGQHWVVMDCDFRPVFEAGVDTDGREDVLRLIAEQPESMQRPGRRQEIVARMQYLGTLKRRMYLGHVDTEQQPLPADSLFTSTDSEQAVGRVVDAQAHPDGGQSVLAVMQIKVAEAGDMHLGSADGPLMVLEPLPYAFEE